MVVALPKGHALARGQARAALPLKALSGETFVVNHHQPRALATMRDDVVAACRAAGFSPREQEAPNVIATLPLVAAGIGIAILPESLQHMNIPGVAYRRLSNTHLKASLSLASRRGDTSAVVRQFVNLVRRRAKDYPGI